MDIVILILAYLFIGSIFTIICEERDWIEVYNGFGYFVFSILWLPLVVIFIPIIIWKTIKKED